MRSEMATKQASGGLYTSSFRAELRAIALALKVTADILSKSSTPHTIHLFTDSLSSLLQLEHGPEALESHTEIVIWQLIQILEKHGHSLLLQYVPGHCGLPGNEQADVQAGLAHKNSRPYVHTDLKTAKAAIKLAAQQAWLKTCPKTSRYAQVTGNRFYPLKGASTRVQETVLMRLRTGHSPFVRGYLRVPLVQNLICPSCRSVLQTLQHLLLDCPANKQDRTTAFKDVPPSVTLKDILTKFSAATIKFLGLITKGTFNYRSLDPFFNNTGLPT